MQLSRSIWNGRVTDPKTRKGRARVPAIRRLAERLEMHRLRCGNPKNGPLFTNVFGKPLALSSVAYRQIMPTLNRCERCGKSSSQHQNCVTNTSETAGFLSGTDGTLRDVAWKAICTDWVYQTS